MEKMKKAGADLLNVLSSAFATSHAGGIQIKEEAAQALLATASEQKLLPLVVDALHDSPGAQAAAALPQFKREARAQVTQQARRSVEFLELYGRLRGAGVFALVVKGCVCRSVWPKGELRISADEDLYVRDGDFAKACDVLRECGLVCDERANPETDFETGWRKPNSTLYVELHRRLFMPGSASAELQDFFDDVFERAKEYEVELGTAKVWSMSPEDHLLYLILHAFKHFIHSGFGIRQVCDIGLWMERYGASLDHDRIMRSLDAAHALYFAAAVLAIAQEDLGIALVLPEAWRGISVDREPMLRDLLDAGIYGSSSMSRRHSAPMTQEAVAASRGNRKKKGLLRRAFPKRQSLERDYPELKGHPHRLPLVWLKRLTKYRKETKKDKSNSAGESLRIAKEREELLRIYRII